MKLCVFQGTFNPIHNGHLTMANYVKTVYDYDQVLFIPAYKPPHKEINEKMSNHRFQMVKLAITGEGFFGISNIEFQNERFSYTYLTIEQLYKKYKIEGKIGFIIGLDAFREITDWLESEKLKSLVDFIVFPRGLEIDKDRLSLLHYKGYKFTLARMKPTEISSTNIRDRILHGKSVAGQVPLVILDYINKNGLYLKEEEEENATENPNTTK
jgi:nicotinate-nucleotide adenylyltransferase